MKAVFSHSMDYLPKLTPRDSNPGDPDKPPPKHPEKQHPDETPSGVANLAYEVSEDDLNNRKTSQDELIASGHPSDGCPSGDPSEEPRLLKQVLGAVTGSLIHVTLGVIVGLPGVVLPALTAGEGGDLQLDTTQAAMFSSLSNLGAIVGSVASGPLMIWLGRRTLLLSVLPIAAVAWVCLALAPSVWFLQVTRVVLGMAVGTIGGPSAIYVAEITHKNTRGRLTGFIDLFRQFGFLFVYVVGSTGLSWRNTSLICGLVSTIIPLLMFLPLPNSPRWLATKGRYDEAKESLKFYRGETYDCDKELSDITTQLSSSNSQAFGDQYKNLFESSVLKRMLLLIFMFFSYQFSGNFSVIVFSVTIFQSVESHLDEYTSTIIVGVVRIFGSLCYIALSDKVSRKSLLTWSSLFASTAMGCLGCYFFFTHDQVQVDKNISWLPLFFLATFIFFTIILESCLILLRSEILPNKIRSLGVSIIYVFFFFGAFLVSYLFPEMMEKIGAHGTFWTYAVDGVLMTLVAGLFIPDTRGKSLEEIDAMYHKAK